MTSARLPTKRLGVLLFPGFELLDVFGPLEMFGVLRHFGEVSVEITIVAKEAGAVTSDPGLEVLADSGYADCSPLDHWIPCWLSMLAPLVSP